MSNLEEKETVANRKVKGESRYFVRNKHKRKE